MRMAHVSPDSASSIKLSICPLLSRPRLDLSLKVYEQVNMLPTYLELSESRGLVKLQRRRHFFRMRMSRAS